AWRVQAWLPWHRPGRHYEVGTLNTELSGRFVEVVFGRDNAVLEGEEYLNQRDDPSRPAGMADQGLVGGDVDRSLYRERLAVRRKFGAVASRRTGRVCHDPIDALTARAGLSVRPLDRNALPGRAGRVDCLALTI